MRNNIFFESFFEGKMTRTVNDSMNQETSQIHTAYLTYSTNALYKKYLHQSWEPCPLHLKVSSSIMTWLKLRISSWLVHLLFNCYLLLRFSLNLRFQTPLLHHFHIWYCFVALQDYFCSVNAHHFISWFQQEMPNTSHWQVLYLLLCGHVLHVCFLRIKLCTYDVDALCIYNASHDFD